MDIIVIFKNGDKKIMQPIGTMKGSHRRIRNWSQFSQFKKKNIATKAITIKRPILATFPQ